MGGRKKVQHFEVEDPNLPTAKCWNDLPVEVIASCEGRKHLSSRYAHLHKGRALSPEFHRLFLQVFASLRLLAIHRPRELGLFNQQISDVNDANMSKESKF